MQTDENGYPRRNRSYLLTPAETAMFDALQAVKRAGADPLLTDAVMLLQQAWNKVADYVELPHNQPGSGEAG